MWLTSICVCTLASCDWSSGALEFMSDCVSVVSTVLLGESIDSDVKHF